jgi:hypothetical protein
VFHEHITTVIQGLAQGVNPRTYYVLISLMKIKKSINENSLNLNILFLNISKQNTKKINFVARHAETLSQVLSRSTRIK